MPHAQPARIPTPTESRLIEPAAVMIRRPTPGIVTDPSPSIPVHPDPAAMSVRGPVHTNADGGPPDPPIRWNLGPNAGRIQVLHAVHAGPNILIAGRLQHGLVATVVPTIPVVARDGFHNLKLRVGGCSPCDHRLARRKPLRSTRRKHLQVACPAGHLGFSRIRYRAPI